MNRYLLTGVALLPLLMSYSHAAQNLAEDPQTQPWGYLSEETGTGAYLGVDVADITGERMSALKLKEEKGVEITMVDQDAPAGKAGIHEHDVILTMNDTPVESGAQLRRMIHETPPGRVVTLGLSRDGQPLTLKVQLGDKHKEFAMMSKSKGPGELYVMPPMPPNMPNVEIPEINVLVVRSSARSGLMVENLTSQLGEFFGVHDGNGVLVRSVEKGSRADKAGLRAGDIIVKVNGEPVHDTDDFTRTLRSNNGASNTVSVVRDKKEQNLNLTLPEHKGDSYGSGSGNGSGKLIEDSRDDSDANLDADVYESTQLTEELAQLEPEINLAIAAEQVQKAEKALEAQEAAQAVQAVHAGKHVRCAQLKALEKRMELKQMDLQKMQIELPKMNFQFELAPEMQEQMERQKRQLERMQHEMQGDWTDI